MTDTNQKLREVATELDRLMLVIESAVRHADPRNHAAVMALILANKEALAPPAAEPVGEHQKKCPTCNWPLEAHDTDEPCKPKPAPVGERLTLSAEDVHAAFVKHFPKTRISQAWIGFAAEIAEAMQARAALSARKPLTSEQVKALKGEYGYSLAPVQAQADFINGIRCGEKAHGIDAAMRKDKP